jgi:hypothetical protein
LFFLTTFDTFWQCVVQFEVVMRLKRKSFTHQPMRTLSSFMHGPINSFLQHTLCLLCNTLRLDCILTNILMFGSVLFVRKSSEESPSGMCNEFDTIQSVCSFCYISNGQIALIILSYHRARDTSNTDLVKTKNCTKTCWWSTSDFPSR